MCNSMRSWETLVLQVKKCALYQSHQKSDRAYDTTSLALSLDVVWPFLIESGRKRLDTFLALTLVRTQYIFLQLWWLTVHSSLIEA